MPQAIFSSSFKSFRDLSRFVLKGIFTWYFSINFSMTSAFCADFSVSDCKHEIGCDGAFVYCWMSCLDLENVDQLLPRQLLYFLCFLVYGIVRWPYTARISLDFLLVWRAITFYGGHRFSSFVHLLYFCATYIRGQIFDDVIMQPVRRQFSLNCFSEWAWLGPTHPYFKEFFVKTFSMTKHYKSASLIKIPQKFR